MMISSPDPGCSEPTRLGSNFVISRRDYHVPVTDRFDAALPNVLKDRSPIDPNQDLRKKPRGTQSGGDDHKRLILPLTPAAKCYVLSLTQLPLQSIRSPRVYRLLEPLVPGAFA